MAIIVHARNPRTIARERAKGVAPKIQPAHNEYWWVRLKGVPTKEPFIVKVARYGTVFDVYPCGDEQGWNADKIHFLRRVPQMRRPKPATKGLK